MDITALKKSTPGWLALGLLGLICTLLSQLIEVGGKHPVEAAVIAIVLGVLIRNTQMVPTWAEAGVKNFEKLLILGIVLIGASLNFERLFSQGFVILSVVAATMLIGLIVIFLASRLFRLSKNLSILLALGTTICGGTAIAICSPLIGAREEETSYAIGTIALWGLLAILIYPELARYFGVTDVWFGIFAGTAIHSTPQVVGAGFIFSELAGKTATAVKLIRNCFLAPVALLCALWFSPEKTEDVDVKKAFPWFLFGYFLMAGLNTMGFLPPDLVQLLSKAGKFFILLGMVGVGLNTRLSAFSSLGLKPIFVGLIGSLVVAITSIGMLSFLL